MDLGAHRIQDHLEPLVQIDPAHVGLRGQPRDSVSGGNSGRGRNDPESLPDSHASLVHDFVQRRHELGSPALKLENT